MTGYESKRAMAQAKLEQAKEILLQHPQKDIDWQREQQIKAHAKLDEEGMYLVHQTASYADNLGKSIVALGKQTVADIEQLGIKPAQEPVACKPLCELCVKRGYTFCVNAVKTTPIPTPSHRKEQNFCSRCGKRTNDIHTCTPPQETTLEKI